VPASRAVCLEALQPLASWPGTEQVGTGVIHIYMYHMHAYICVHTHIHRGLTHRGAPATRLLAWRRADGDMLDTHINRVNPRCLQYAERVELGKSNGKGVARRLERGAPATRFLAWNRAKVYIYIYRTLSLNPYPSPHLASSAQRPSCGSVPP